MIKICYDHQIFSSQQYGGISRYFYELARRVSEYPDVDITVLALAYINQYLSNGLPCKLIGWRFPYIPKTGLLRKTLNNVISKPFIKHCKPDIIHETYYSAGPIATTKAKTVITVYDMIHEIFHEGFANRDKTRERKKFSVRRADHIICISKNTRNDLLEIYKINSAKISVVYLASSLGLAPDTSNDLIITAPYILYVGDRGGYKNFRRVLAAYAKSSKLKADFHLVCFGGGVFKSAEIEEIRSLNLNLSKVIQISGNDTLLANLYTNAHVFVCPSLYEGFGIPLLEAMSLRCPVVCGNTSSLPEVAGNAAEFFDPYDVEHIIHSLEKVVYSNDRSTDLLRLGLERIRKFSWDRCASQTYEIYSTVLGK